jgi:hypothetical protein
MKLLGEIPLKLTRKCLDMFGTNAAVYGETTRKTICKWTEDVCSRKEELFIKANG